MQTIQWKKNINNYNIFFYKKTKSNKYTYKDIGFLTSFEKANNIMNEVFTILSFFPKKSNSNKYIDIVLLYQMFPPYFEVRFCFKNSNR